MIGESVPKLILGTGGQIPRYLVPMLQTIVARRVDPFDTATVTIGSFDGTERYNAIKDQVTLKGDVRMMNESTHGLIRDQIEVMAQDGGNYPHHSPRFKMNEASILIAAKAVATVAWHYFDDAITR